MFVQDRKVEVGGAPDAGLAVQGTAHESSRGIAARAQSHVALYGIYEISKVIALPERLEVTLARVLHLLSSFLDMGHGLIALLGQDGAPEIVVGSGWSEATAKRYFDRLPERAIGQIVVTEMPLVVENMRQDPVFESWDFSAWGQDDAVVSFIGVPIKDRGHVIGTLTVDSQGRDGPSLRLDDDVRFLNMVANLVGQTVRLQRLIARDRERMIEEQHRLEKQLAESSRVTSSDAEASHPGGIVGESAAIRAVLEKVRLVARSHSTVLLRGESGTGKELFARALHDLSPRKDRAFVTVNCAALSESVLESELFGHERGSFTGAAGTRKGRFELADGGTLFLDEIGEISPAFQAKLLRVLQEGEFERLGGSSTLKVDVRLVAATNRDLETAVANKQFRSDLYYRITVVPIFLPPLRERTSDIPLLASEFLRRFNEENGRGLELTDAAISVLTACWFPGNVRELENCVRRTATFARGLRIVADDFACRHDECLSSALWKLSKPAAAGVSQGRVAPLPSAGRAGASSAPAAQPVGGASCAEDQAMAGCPGRETCAGAAPEKSERERLIEAMDAAGWVQAKAARILGLTPRQIGYALRKHDIPIQKF
jgi:Nif-specific regulatory protein